MEFKALLTSSGTAVPICFNNQPRARIPLGTDDDPGIYVYLTWLLTTFDLATPQIAMKWLFLTCFALLITVSPCSSTTYLTQAFWPWSGQF